MSKNSHQPKLIFVGEPFDGRTCELELETTTVGRSSSNHLCIQDPSVSAKHCEILTHESEIIVRDLKSSNGTFVNAVRIEGQAQLKHGQILRIGNVNARLELAMPDATHSNSDATAIYQHAKVTREARAERENPQQPPQPVKLDAGNPDASSEHTVAFSRPAPAPATAPANTGRTPTESGTGSGLKWILIAAAAAAALWFLFR